MAVTAAQRQHWQQRLNAEAAAVAERAIVARQLAQEAAERLLERWPDLQGIWLFGSLHDGRFGLTSDVDLAVAGLPADALMSAMALLEPLQDGEIVIDLVRLEDLDLHWQQRIQERGDVLRAVS
jgi:predicted nucleotidyltransferase